MCTESCCSPRPLFIIRSVYACVGIVLGLGICAVFNVPFPNKGAAYLGLCSSVFAAVCLVQYIYVYVRTELHQRQAHLSAICVFAVIGTLGISVGLGSTVTFLGLGIVDSINHVDLSLPRTHYVAAVWAFGTFKWGLIAFVHALRTFRKLIKSQSRTLQQDQADDGAALIPGGESINSSVES